VSSSDNNKKNNLYRIFKSDIRERIKCFSIGQTVYFAGLCAIRALPFLCATYKYFSFWKDSEKQKHLYAIFNAIDVTLKYQNKDARFVANAAYAVDAATAAAYAADRAYATNHTANAATAAAVTDAVANAAYAAYAADRAYATNHTANAATAAAYAADATYYAIYVIGKHVPLKSIILNDIELIKTNNLNVLNNDVVGVYGEIWRNFQYALSAIGCGYWAKLYTDLFTNKFVVDKKELERRLNVPPEIKAQGAAAVAEFLEASKSQGVKRLNEARIVILGDKGAGKTSLARKLYNIDANVTEEHESTEGVDVTHWMLSEKDRNAGGVNVHIWDFAGHVVTHAVHRFFLSERCIYIIVYSGRDNDRNIDDSIEYWLDHAKTYGGDSPVYIVVNKKDSHTPEIDENNLKDKYPNTIKGVKYLSIKADRDALEAFRNELEEFIRQSPAWNKEIPALWFDMKEKLHEYFEAKKEHINIAEFCELARNLGVSEADFVSIRKPLHALGICLWYEKIAQLNMFVLNPSWISYGVYKIINWLKEEKRHELWFTDFPQIFSKKEDVSRFPSDKYRFLFTILSAYELAYSIENSKGEGLIIPILLPQKQPEQGMDRDFPVTDSLLMRYKTENTLPPDTISRFIVRHHPDIQVNKDKQPIVWRRGVKLEDKNRNHALVVEYNREILLYVKGVSAKSYLIKLRTTLNDIFQNYQSNKPTLEYKITETMEQKPVYADDGTIIAYDIDGRLYLDATTGKEINMTIINENLAVTDGVINKGNHNSVSFKSKNAIVGSTVNLGLTVDNFHEILRQLSIFLQTDATVKDELSPKDERTLNAAIVEARKQTDPQKGWNMLERFIGTSASIANVLLLFFNVLPPGTAAVAGIAAGAVITAGPKLSQNLIDKIKNRLSELHNKQPKQP